MLVSEAISHINYALRGIDDNTPVVGSEEYTYWLSVLNRKRNELYRDSTKNWPECFDIRNIGTISASLEPSYELPDDFLAPSDYIYTVTLDGKRDEFSIIKPTERLQSTREVYVVGKNPKVLHFTNEIKTDERIIGASLMVPGYYVPADLGTDDELDLPDPYWGVMATASAVAFNDIIYETKAPDLNDQANSLFRQMTSTNRRGTYANPRVTPRSIRRLGGTSRRRR